MKLNHLDLQVSDVQRSVAFFEHFTFQLRSSRTSPAIAIMDDGDGFVLVLQRRKNEDEAFPDGFHVGFLVDDVETVHATHARLRAEALPVSDIEVNGRGTMFYCRAPDGYAVEVSCRRAPVRSAGAPTGDPPGGRS